MKRPLIPLICLCALQLALGRLAAKIQERFESAEVSWRLAEADGPALLLIHQREFGAAHAGQGCEHLRLRAGQATKVLLSHPVTPAPIIRELAPSLWIKADRPGLRLLARAVLPRSRDDNGKVLTVLLDGDIYTGVSSWQQLHVRDLKKLLLREVGRLRLQFGAVDEREAYVDHLILNAYGGPGVTDLWIDDLDLGGAASIQAVTAAIERDPMRSTVSSGAFPQVAEEQNPATLQGSVLLVGKQPFFARIIEHNGEPFTWLKSIGFNTILLRQAPTDAQLGEARHSNVWLVAPPPTDQGELSIGSAHRRVIAWQLGSGFTSADAADVANLAEEVRRRDPVVGRPVCCDVDTDPGAFHSVDLLLFGRRTIGTTFDLRHYGDWLKRQMRTTASKPFWGAIQSEPSQQIVEQLALSGTQPAKQSADPEQMRLMAFESIAVGARGVHFRSRSRLDLDDDTTKLRAAGLQLLNAELTLIEPWAAGGLASGEVDSNDPDARVRVLQTDRSRLLVVTRHADEQQYVPHPRPTASLSFAVHAAPITDQAYVLAAEGVQPLRRSRAGARISLPGTDTISLVLLTQDPLAVNRVSRALLTMQSDAARLRQQIATMQLRQTQQVLAQLGHPNERAELLIDQAIVILERAEQLLRSGDDQHAAAESIRATDLMRQVRREAWETAAHAFPSTASSPLCSSFESLPLHALATSHLAAGDWSPNQLQAGGFESLDKMIGSGWTQHRHEISGAETDVELSPTAPADGRTSLRLVSAPTSGNQPLAGNWPVSVTSAPVLVREGQIVRVRGWVKIPRPIRDSFDGLMIVDSVAGRELADRVLHTEGWHEFSLYRVATQSGDFTVTFALTGFGEAWIDEVSVSVQ